MFSSRTKLQLAALLMQLAEGEKHLEITRQVLAEIDEFYPYTSFRRFDKNIKGYVVIKDFQEFFEQNGLNIPISNIKYIFHNWDSNHDEKLSYTDFLNFILTKDNPKLRSKTLEKETVFIKKDEFLPYEVEWALLRILEYEINFNDQIQKVKINLVQTFDFSYQEAFNVVNADQVGRLNSSDVRNFLEQNGFRISNYDLKCLLRRLDSNKDSKISYQDFVEAIVPGDNYIKEQSQVFLSLEKTPKKSKGKLSTTATKQSTAYTTKHKDIHTKRGTLTEPRKKARTPIKHTTILSVETSPNYQNKFPKYSFTTNNSFMYTTPQKNQKIVKESTNKEIEKAVVNQSKSPMKRNEAYQLAKMFKRVFCIDEELENLKCDLAARVEFNLFDAFRIFDLNCRGSINYQELEQGLKKLQIPTNQTEIYLFTKSFDTDQDGILKFSDFCDIIQPKTPEYGELLCNKMPLSNSSGENSRDMNQQTKQHLAQLLKSIIKAELEIEQLRQKLSVRRLFSVINIFKKLDQQNKGYITSVQFQNFLKSNGIITTTKDIQHLMIRFDINKNGKITYPQFKQEITPKLFKF